MLAIMTEYNEEIRRVAHRGLNMMLADLFRGTGHRLTPSAGIPMYSPGEAIDELEYAVNELGFKTATYGTEVRLPPPEISKQAPQLSEYFRAVYPVCMDSLRDYDPVWRKCLELRIAVASHTGCANLAKSLAAPHSAGA